MRSFVFNGGSGVCVYILDVVFFWGWGKRFGSSHFVKKTDVVVFYIFLYTHAFTACLPRLHVTQQRWIGLTPLLYILST